MDVGIFDNKNNQKNRVCCAVDGGKLNLQKNKMLFFMVSYFLYQTSIHYFSK